MGAAHCGKKRRSAVGNNAAQEIEVQVFHDCMSERPQHRIYRRHWIGAELYHMVTIPSGIVQGLAQDGAVQDGRTRPDGCSHTRRQLLALWQLLQHVGNRCGILRVGQEH